MGAHNNECDSTKAGKQAALDLATARPDEFSNRCALIDEQLSHRSPESSKQFLTAMTSELEQRNLLPKVELNFVSQNDAANFGLLASDRHRHISANGLQQTQDYLASNGKLVESELVHGLIIHQKDIESTHAERNFSGRNHPEIDMDRLQRWEHNARPDLTDLSLSHTPAASENSSSSHAAGSQINPFRSTSPAASDSSSSSSSSDAASPQISPFRKQFQDAQRNFEHENEKREHDLDELKKVVPPQKAQQTDEAKHIQELHNRVVRDAHQTVQHGDTLYDMAVVSLVRTNKTHFSQADVHHEIEKLRALNHLAPHQQLRSGQSLMLRTPQEVDHEVNRRLRLEKANAPHEEPRLPHAPYLVC